MQRHAVIYIFGLGDQRATGQTLAVRVWRMYGVTPEVFHTYWATPGKLADKLAGLLARIDTLTEQGYTVSLVGTSAGASAAIHAYAARQDKVHRVVCVCGKLQNPETISAYTYTKNPAFREAMETLDQSLQTLSAEKRSRILSIRPVADNIVPPADTVIPGAASEQVPTTGHALSITFCITVYAGRLLRFIKSQQS